MLALLDGAPGDDATIHLAALIERLGDGVGRFDEQFARTVALTLHERAPHLAFPVIDPMGVQEVVATLYMDRALRLVVTGNHTATRGAFQMRWDERDFDQVEVRVTRAARVDPYVFATLDFSVRGKLARLLVAHPPVPAEQTVTIRALATIGGVVEYRVTALDTDFSVAPEALALL